jgi:hypothetical protein
MFVAIPSDKNAGLPVPKDNLPSYNLRPIQNHHIKPVTNLFLVSTMCMFIIVQKIKMTKDGSMFVGYLDQASLYVYHQAKASPGT